MNKKLENLVIAFALFLSSIVLGVIVYMELEGYRFIDAFYMTIITIGTVGFTEVHELSQPGRLFTAFYILINLGIFAYVLSVFTSYIFEGKLRSIFRSIMEEKELNKTKDHIIVCGFGRNGSRACDELRASHKDFVVIEKNPQLFQGPSAGTNYKIVIGDATEDEHLRLAGIERAKVIIITTPSDAANVFIALTARALNPKIKIISRASEKETEGKLFRAGADKVIMPDMLGGMFMAQLITKPVVIDFLNLLTGISSRNEGYHLEEIGYKDLKTEFREKTLKELRVTELTGSTVIGVKDEVKGLIPGPDPDIQIGPNDYLIVLGSHKTLNKFMNHFTTLTYHIQNF